VIVDAHPKEFIGIKLHQTVFLTGLDKYICIVCIVQKKKVSDKGLYIHLNKWLTLHFGTIFSASYSFMLMYYLNLYNRGYS